jgi:hypothetical protein
MSRLDGWKSLKQTNELVSKQWFEEKNPVLTIRFVGSPAYYTDDICLVHRVSSNPNNSST